VNLVWMASALTMVCGMGVRYGWLNAIAAAGLLALTLFLVRVAREAPRIFRLLCAQPPPKKGRRIADFIVCAGASLSRKESARDLALEAISTLDDMAEDGHEGGRLIISAVWLALRLPASIRDRARSNVATPSIAGDRSPGTRQEERTRREALHYFLDEKGRLIDEAALHGLSKTVRIEEHVVLTRLEWEALRKSVPRAAGKRIRRVVWAEVTDSREDD
jgi:hypothetical protein